MKLHNSSLQRFFTVNHKGKTYYVDYLNSEGPICGLFNRFTWQILDEELEEVYACTSKDSTKKEIEEAKLIKKLINFCKKHFNDYQPDPEDC